MNVNVTSAAITTVPGTPNARLVQLQNQNTDTDFWFAFQGGAIQTVTAAGSSDGGIMLARAQSATQPTTLFIGGAGLEGVVCRPILAISNNTAAKPLTVIVNQ